MGMTNRDRVTLHRQRERPVTVIVSEREIDFLLASGYQLSRQNAEYVAMRSSGRDVGRRRRLCRTIRGLT